MKKTSKEKVSVKEASHNLFADFGIADATEKNAKIQLAVAINEIIGTRYLSQKDAAELMDCTQPEVSSQILALPMRPRKMQKSNLRWQSTKSSARAICHKKMLLS